MGLRIRIKLVLLLTIVALLPLVAGLIAVAIQSRNFRFRSAGQDQMAIAVAQAESLENSLQANLEKVLLSLQDDPDVINDLGAMSSERSLKEMLELDSLWKMEPFPVDNPIVTMVLKNHISDHLHSIIANSEGIAELLVTDRFGALVAASGRTTDYYQADEEWWQAAYADGKGKAYVSYIRYDRSANVWSIELCIPLRLNGQAIGVGKAVLAVSRWLEAAGLPVGTEEAKGLLLNASGQIVYPHIDPTGQEAPLDWAVAISRSGSAGWTAGDEDVIRSYAPVSLPDVIGGIPVSAPVWTLVLQQPKAAVLAEVNRMMWSIISGGTTAILMVFVSGVVLVDRSIGRRIRRLQSVTGRIGRGDFMQRANEKSSHIGTDEIDDLAMSINDMMDRIAQSQEELRKSDELIRSTGHMAKVGGWELDANTLQMRWTDEISHIYELPEGKVPPLEEALNYFHPDDRPRLEGAIRRALDYGEPYDLELKFTSTKGRSLWIHTSCTPKLVNGKTVKLSGTFQDITARKLAEEEAVNLAKFPEENPSPVLRIRSDGDVLYANTAAKNLTGSGQVGRLDATFSRWLPVVKRVLASGMQEELEEEFDGRVVSFVFAPVVESGYVNIYGRDITGLKQIEAELTQANALKSGFIKVAGHELRTPLSYIMAMPKLMEHVDDLEKLHYAIRTMEAKGRRLNDIVQSMFKLMPEQEYSEHLNLQDVELSQILQEVRSDVQPFVEERNQTLVMAPCDNMPVLRADPDKIHDVIENLVGNAIKFTPVGGTIHVSAAIQDADNVSIAVEDQGPGISDDDLPNIFNPFFSTGDVMKHSSGSIGATKYGMGLGLAVVKHFVNMHRGTVDVTTGPGGSIFTVTLPIRPKRDEDRGVAGDAI